MSLIEAWKEPCVKLEKSSVPDGEGGFRTGWTDGAGFLAAVSVVNTAQAVIAERQGMKKVFTVTTDRALPLGFHDAFRRLSDGRVLRVTSDGKDVRTPAKSAITPFSQATAEEWELPV